MGGALRMRRVGFAAVVAAWGALLAGCTHGDLFRAPVFGTTDPYSSAGPVRLTLSAGIDLWPSWLPDGSGILYTSERLDRLDRDWCLAVLPPGGGRITRTLCENTKPGEDSVETFQSASVSPDGRVLFVRSSGPARTPGATEKLVRSRGLMMGSIAGPLSAQRIFSIPFTPPGYRTLGDLSQIRWLGPNTIVYRGDLVATVCVFVSIGCRGVYVQSGIALIYQILGEAPVRIVLPGTDYASSVAAGESGDELYYTLGGDSRVYRLTLSTYAVSVVHDFGAAGIARDVDVRGTKLVAVVGGPIIFNFNSTINAGIQFDTLGGDVHVVDLSTGADTTLAAQGRLFRHPALSPAGNWVVAESKSSGSWDLWLLGVP
jgi:hypothetical protein